MLMLNFLIFRRPRLVAHRTFPFKMVQSVHVLESCVFGAEIARTGVAFEGWSMVTCGMEMVFTSAPSCLEDLVACATFKLVAHISTGDTTMDIDELAVCEGWAAWEI